MNPVTPRCLFIPSLFYGFYIVASALPRLSMVFTLLHRTASPSSTYSFNSNLLSRFSVPGTFWARGMLLGTRR